jgi:hypothetical protein
VQNVLPHLTGPVKSKVQISKEIIEFVGSSPEFWAYYADYDWVALCQLYGRMIDLPETWPMFCRDLKQYAEDNNLPKYHLEPTIEHNALCDAIWTKQAFEYYQYLLKLRNSEANTDELFGY